MFEQSRAELEKEESGFEKRWGYSYIRLHKLTSGIVLQGGDYSLSLDDDKQDDWRSTYDPPDSLIDEVLIGQGEFDGDNLHFLPPDRSRESEIIRAAEVRFYKYEPNLKRLRGVDGEKPIAGHILYSDYFDEPKWHIKLVISPKQFDALREAIRGNEADSLSVRLQFTAYESIAQAFAKEPWMDLDWYVDTDSYGMAECIAENIEVFKIPIDTLPINQQRDLEEKREVLELQIEDEADAKAPEMRFIRLMKEFRELQKSLLWILVLLTALVVFQVKDFI